MKSILRLKKWSKGSIELIPEYFKTIFFDAIIFGRISFIFLSYYLAIKTNRQSYFFMHGKISSRISLLSYKYLLKKMKIIPIANSIYTMKSFGNFCKYYFYPGYDESRISTSFQGESFRGEYSIDEESLVFGIAGRICYFKAQDWITKILMQEKYENKKIVLLLAGVIQDQLVMDKIKEYAGSKFGSRIIYLGNLSDISKFYSSIDVLINSGKGPESFGISVIEARASKLPIIASSIGGTKETVVNGCNGWTFDGFSYLSHEKVIQKVINEKAKINEYGANSLKNLSEFSTKYNVREFIKLINEVNESR